MAMPLGVAVFGFSSQMRFIDAKIGNVIFDCCTLNYVNLPIRALARTLAPQRNAFAQRFIYRYKEEIFSYIPHFELACERMELNFDFTLKMKFLLNYILLSDKL